MHTQCAMNAGIRHNHSMLLTDIDPRSDCRLQDMPVLVESGTCRRDYLPDHEDQLGIA